MIDISKLDSCMEAYQILKLKRDNKSLSTEYDVFKCLLSCPLLPMACCQKR